MQLVQYIVTLLAVLAINVTVADKIYNEFLDKHKLYKLLVGLTGLRKPSRVLLTEDSFKNYTIEELHSVHDKFAKKSLRKTDHLLRESNMCREIKKTIFKIGNARLFNNDRTAVGNSDLWSDFLNGNVTKFSTEFIVRDISGMTKWQPWILDRFENGDFQLAKGTIVDHSNNLAVALNALTLRDFLKYTDNVFNNIQLKDKDVELWRQLYKQLEKHFLITDEFILATIDPGSRLIKKCMPLMNLWKFVHTNSSTHWSSFYPVKKHQHISKSWHYIDFEVPIDQISVKVALASGPTEEDIFFKFVIAENGSHYRSTVESAESIRNGNESIMVYLKKRQCPHGLLNCFTISWNYEKGQVKVTEDHTKLVEFSDQKIKKLSHFALRSGGNSTKQWKMKSNSFPHYSNFFWCPVSPSLHKLKVSPYKINSNNETPDWYVCLTKDSIIPCGQNEPKVVAILKASRDACLGDWHQTEDGSEDSYVVLAAGSRPPVFLCADKTTDDTYHYGFREPWSRNCVILGYGNGNDVSDDYSSTSMTLRVGQK